MSSGLNGADADRAAKIDKETSDIGADLRGGAVLRVIHRQLAA